MLWLGWAGRPLQLSYESGGLEKIKVMLEKVIWTFPPQRSHSLLAHTQPPPRVSLSRSANLSMVQISSLAHGHKERLYWVRKLISISLSKDLDTKLSRCIKSLCFLFWTPLKCWTEKCRPASQTLMSGPQYNLRRRTANGTTVWRGLANGRRESACSRPVAGTWRGAGSRCQDCQHQSHLGAIIQTTPETSVGELEKQLRSKDGRSSTMRD